MERLYQLIPKLNDSMRKYLYEHAHECGLDHGQPRILDYLVRHDGCIQKDFCDEYSLEASSVSNMLAIMEREGILNRERTNKTSRTVNVYITDSGREVQRKFGEVYDKVEEITFKGFTEEEKEAFLGYFDRAVENMMSYNKSVKRQPQNRRYYD